MKAKILIIGGVFTVFVLVLSLGIDFLFPPPNPELRTFNFSMHGDLVFDDAFRGTNPDSPLVYAYFVDFTCPVCAQKHPDFLQLLEEHPEVNFLIKHTVDYRSEESVFASVAFECLRAQGQKWDLKNYLFSEPFTREQIIDYVQFLGIDYEQFLHCTEDETTERIIEADTLHASYLGVRGTPTVFLNGIRIEGYHTFDVYSQMIQREWNELQGASTG
ncbi:MAG: DsbA family protein [Candidatus Woesearchaeota archaeon]